MGLRHISAAANHLVDHSQTLCKLINTPCTCHTHTLALAHTPSHGCTNARILLVSGMYISSLSQLARCGERDVKSLIQWVFFSFLLHFSTPSSVHPVILDTCMHMLFKNRVLDSPWTCQQETIPFCFISVSLSLSAISDCIDKDAKQKAFLFRILISSYTLILFIHIYWHNFELNRNS